MIIDIADILFEAGQSKEFEGNVVVSDIAYQGEDIRFDKPLYVKGMVVNGGEFIVLNVKVLGNASLLCGACTEPYNYTVDYEIQINLKPSLDTEDPDIYVYTNNIIIMEDILVREFIHRLPMQRRCLSECKGLCPHCGINLNNEECQCLGDDNGIIDSRLSILKKFFNNKDTEV